MNTTFRGYYAIALTPFNSSGDLLWDELKSECDWIARSGAHGMVWPVNNSEFTVLSFPERLRGMELVVKAVGGRIPVVLGVGDTSKAGAVALAESAGKAGADAIIAMPPWDVKMSSRTLIKDYFKAIAEAAGIPVFIQNLGEQVGSSLSGSFMAELCREIPLVQYVKEERDPHGPNVDEVIALAEPKIRGVFTGGQGLGIVDSFKRGAAGNMASAELADIYAQIWDLMESGDEKTARKIQMAEAVAFKAMRTYASMRPRKEILVRRGVFSGNYCRNLGVNDLDKVFLSEIGQALKAVEPYYRV
jgi:dihydrodipicolinate synthase/N-acetylneuraminate lyase